MVVEVKRMRPDSSQPARLNSDCIKVSPPQHGGAVPAPLSERWAEMARNYLEGPDHPVAPNRLDSFFLVAVH